MPHEVGGSAETRRLLTMMSALAASVLCPRSRCLILRVFPALLTSWPWVSVVEMRATGRNSRIPRHPRDKECQRQSPGSGGSTREKKKKNQALLALGPVVFSHPGLPALAHLCAFY